MTRLAAEVVESSQEPRRRAFAWAWSAPAITMYCYLAGAIYLTARIWVNPKGLSQTGDTEDVDQATWFIRYTATAVSHFRLPALETIAMNAPHGVNLMWNTSLLLPGIVVAPVTLIFGLDQKVGAAYLGQERRQLETPLLQILHPHQFAVVINQAELLHHRVAPLTGFGRHQRGQAPLGIEARRD